MSTERQLREAHFLAGRIAAAVTPAIASFCRCGLAYFGRDVLEADDRLDEHIRTELTLATVDFTERTTP